jgi:hypothetical protein
MSSFTRVLLEAQARSSTFPVYSVILHLAQRTLIVRSPDIPSLPITSTQVAWCLHASFWWTSVRANTLAVLFFSFLIFIVLLFYGRSLSDEVGAGIVTEAVTFGAGWARALPGYWVGRLDVAFAVADAAWVTTVGQNAGVLGGEIFPVRFVLHLE